MTDPTGESADGALRLDFDRRLMLRFRGAASFASEAVPRTIADAGLLAYRELDDALGLTSSAGAALADARWIATQAPMVDPAPYRPGPPPGMSAETASRS